MLSKFEHIIENELCFLKTTPFVLAVSGGIDSMVLLDLCIKTNLNFIVAHCNYQLRGSDSDMDEQLVQETCKSHGIHFEHIKFDTNSMIKDGQSIQTLARDLRYDWFNELKLKHSFSFVMLAHHLNDQLETMLINMSRGSGVKGLRGMSINQSGKIRPLLSFTKSEIEEYAVAQSVQYRTDASNADSKYKRNFIRNSITPLLEELHPEFWKNFAKTNAILSKQSDQLEQSYKNNFNQLITADSSYELPIKDLIRWFESGEATPTLSAFDLSTNQVQELIKLTSAENGKLLETKKFSFVKDNSFIFAQKAPFNFESFSINDLGSFSLLNNKYQLDIANEADVEEEENRMLLDASSIKFPLNVRLANAEDKFQPFGMGKSNGRKSVFKFLKDRGVNVLKRKRAFVIEDVDGIIMIIGHQIDDSRKTTAETKSILSLSKVN